MWKAVVIALWNSVVCACVWRAVMCACEWRQYCAHVCGGSSVRMCVEGSVVRMCVEARAYTSFCRFLLYLLRQDLSPQNSLRHLVCGLPEPRTPNLGLPSTTMTGGSQAIPAFLWMLEIQTPCPQTSMQTVLVAFPLPGQFVVKPSESFYPHLKSLSLLKNSEIQFQNMNI